jgi:anhydro-N-acetylmuramic acid kinase
MLRERLGAARILLSDDLGISCDAKEAVSFAVLAHATIKGVANNVPSATGANQPLVLGKIVPA